MSKATWVLDPSHSLVEFSVKHMMIATVKGRFSKFEGALTADVSDLTTAEIAVTADVASIDTRDSQRDDHLRSADFFDVEQFPTLTFQSARIERVAGAEYKLTGNLTIHGVTHEVTFDTTFEGTGKDPWGNERAGFSAEAKINRKDYGLVWNVALETGGILVGDQVKIAIQISAVKQAA